MKMRWIHKNVWMGVTLTYALGTAGAASGAKANGNQVAGSSPTTQATDSNSALQAVPTATVGQGGTAAGSSSGQDKTDSASGKGKGIADGKAQRDKFEKAEKAIEASSDKMDNDYVNAVRERNKARRQREKGERTPQVVDPNAQTGGNPGN